MIPERKLARTPQQTFQHPQQSAPKSGSEGSPDIVMRIVGIAGNFFEYRRERVQTR
jgi:hypothetical protein